MSSFACYLGSFALDNDITKEDGTHLKKTKCFVQPNLQRLLGLSELISIAHLVQDIHVTNEGVIIHQRIGSEMSLKQ